MDHMFEIHLLRFTSSISIDFRNEECLCDDDVQKIVDMIDRIITERLTAMVQPLVQKSNFFCLNFIVASSSES